MPTPAEEKAFLEPILARHSDDGPRLVYADFLDESDEPADRARGELIRVQCALARISDDHPRRVELIHREGELLQAHLLAWTDHLRGLADGFEFRRGLLEGVSVGAATFLARGAELFRRAPIRRVRLIDAARHVARIAACPLLASVRELDLCGNDLGNGGVNVLLRSPHLDRVQE
ncbi:MAG TPA: TIGR02996 domain-containing protein, partial [Fimbriiglobus sp.]|nr:TIGR02996 domain-containing protein [Fimbriiglobus sp.]